MYHSAKSITGSKVSASDGEVGKVYDLYFDGKSWEIRYLAVDTGQWLEGQCVWGSPMSIQQVDWDNRVIQVNFTREHIQSSPDVDTVKPEELRKLEDLRKNASWPAFRVFPMSSGYSGVGYPFNSPGAAVLGVVPGRIDGEPGTLATEPPEEVPEPTIEDTPLRSAIQVESYKISAEDGQIGRVQDFLIDDKTWTIGYVVVNTGSWLPGKQVLVPVDFVTEANWQQSLVGLCVSRDQVKSSPAYDDSVPLTREYESKLYEHYGLPKRWE